MPNKPLQQFSMCIKQGLNNFTRLDTIYRARDSLAAAKKIYRKHKLLKEVYVLNLETKEIHYYSTEYFFTKKKEHKIKRR
jgi:hypothetical protein